VAKLLAWDRRGRIGVAPIQSPEGDARLAGLSDEERLRSWHFVDAQGRRHSAGAAAAPLLRELPGGGAPAALLERFPAATDRAYGWIAEHRSAFGRPLSNAAKRRADARIRRRRGQATG
jgi:predicted DCC family thiol-disulfide oxidoreductase YuxK